MREPKRDVLAQHDRRHWLGLAAVYMNQCFAAPSVPRVGEFAARISHSREWVTRMFTTAVGKSPASVFRAMQISRAKTLLRNTEDPTAQIARAAAFGSQRAFYRTFRDCTGVSPGFYRRNRPGTRNETP